MKKFSYAPILLSAFMALPLVACGKKVTVTWKNEDGTVLETDVIKKKGTIPTYDGATPTKAATPEYTYTFAGWDAEVVATGKEDVVYTATYTATKNKYTVTWKNYDGSNLEVDENVEYGATPTYDGTDPTKPSSNTEVFSFIGWSPAVSSVIGDVSYTAQFSTSTRLYQIKWVDGNGDVLKTDNLEYGAMPSYSGTTPTKLSTVDTVFTFADDWEEDIVSVTGDATYHAAFNTSTRQYEITWKDDLGNILRVDTLDYGAVPSYGSDPEKDASDTKVYSFTGWDTTPVAVTGDATYTATFSSADRIYTVQFKDYDGTVLGTKDMHYDDLMSPLLNPVTSDPTMPDDGDKTYQFIGWDRAYTNVNSSTTVYNAAYLEYELHTDVYYVTGVTTSFFEGEVSIPDTYKGKNVTQISPFAFNNKRVRGLTIGANVTYIGEGAFGNCDIQNLVIPANVSIIDAYAFNGCAKLNEIVFNSTTLMIRNRAFEKTAIQVLELPSAISYVGNYAFANCHNLYVVSIANTSVIQSDTFAFDGSITEVWLPNGGSIPGSHDISYYYYTSITGAALDTDKGTFTKQAADDENDVLGLVFYTPHGATSDKYLVSCFGNGHKLGTGDATKIKKWSFYKNEQITEAYIGNEVIVFEEKCFYAASNLAKLEFEEGTSQLDIYGYRTLASLAIQSIDFSPRPIYSLGYYLFDGCTQLSQITYSSATTSLYDYCFNYCGFVELPIPASITSIGTDAFRSRDKLEKFVVDKANTNYKSEDDCLFSKDGTILYAFPTAKVCPDNIYTIPEGVTTLRGRVFSNSALTLTEVRLPSTLAEIGEFAFINCSNLGTLRYPGTVAEFELLSLYKSYTNSWAHNPGFSYVTCSNGTSTKNM